MLQAEEITFINQRQALCLSVSNQAEIPPALEALQLPVPCPVIVWIGGAGSMAPQYAEPVSQIAHSVAHIAQESKAIIVDGATDGGVIAVLGQVYAQSGYTFPLVGVVAKQLVFWSNVPGKQRVSLVSKFRKAIASLLVGSAGRPWHLDPHHTHFFLVPGNHWGAESAWISDIATQIAGDHPSVTILSNARVGGICVQDVDHSLEANRPIIVIAGTGGWADELASEPPQSKLWEIVSVADRESIRNRVLEHLAQ
jgi:hypothetical protein